MPHLNGNEKPQVVLFPPHDDMTTSSIIVMSSSFSALNNSIQKRFLGNKWKGPSSCSLFHRAKGADFRSPLQQRRRHGRRRVFIFQILGPRSHIGSMRSQLLLDMSDTDNTPRRVALGNCEESMENISEELRTWDLGTHNC